MAVKDKTLDELLALQGTRGPAGMLHQAQGAEGYQPLMSMLHQLAFVAAAAGALMVCPDDSAANAVYVLPGRCNIDGVSLGWAGGMLSLGPAANNATTYVWAFKSGSSVQLGKDVAGVGWPITLHIKLAAVTMASGAITTITDYRPELWLKV